MTCIRAHAMARPTGAQLKRDIILVGSDARHPMASPMEHTGKRRSSLNLFDYVIAALPPRCMFHQGASCAIGAPYLLTYYLTLTVARSAPADSQCRRFDRTEAHQRGRRSVGIRLPATHEHVIKLYRIQPGQEPAGSEPVVSTKRQ